MKTPWGKATAVAEVALPPRPGSEKPFEPVVQLLETAEGERLVRFAYRTAGRVRRGPVTVRVQDLVQVRRALGRVPELRRALVGDP